MKLPSLYRQAVLVSAMSAVLFSASAAQAVTFNFIYESAEKIHKIQEKQEKESKKKDQDLSSNLAIITDDQRLGFEIAGKIWAEYLDDDVEINIGIGMRNGLSEPNTLGSASPGMDKKKYKDYAKALQADESSVYDHHAIESLKEISAKKSKPFDKFNIMKNDKDKLQKGKDVYISRANSKALGLIDADKKDFDAFIQLDGSRNWNYDFLNEGSIGSNQYDFLTVALHEIAHGLGFISGVSDIEEATTLDLFRYSNESQKNHAIDLRKGSDSFFSIGDAHPKMSFAGHGDDHYEESHWRSGSGSSIMAAKLESGNRLHIDEIDLQALDVIGWDINSNADLDIETLRRLRAEAQATVDGSINEFDPKKLEEAMNSNKRGSNYDMRRWARRQTDGSIAESQAVPEPTSVLALVGLALLGIGARRQQS